MTREQIVKIMDDYRSETRYGISSSDISLVADAILALPLTERHYCKSCGEELDDYCLKCQKLWES